MTLGNDFVMESSIRTYEIWSNVHPSYPQFYIKYYGKGWWRRLLDSDTVDMYYPSFEVAYATVRAFIVNDDPKPHSEHKRIL